MKIEKEHERSTLMNRRKTDLVDHIMCLTHNNNVLYDTSNQQAENYKAMMRDMYNKLDQKSFTVDTGHKEEIVVSLDDIKKELLI